MVYLRLMKFPGAKTALIPDIRENFMKSQLEKFIDVFGGSGAVSLNIKANFHVYNDIDEELVNLFNLIQKKPDSLLYMLKNSTRTGEFLNEPQPSKNPTTTKKGALNNEDQAFSTLFRFIKGFGGMGETYDTKEKSTFRYVIKTMEQFEAISKSVSAWTIENLDFRELFAKYDSRNAFFYIDPPYSDKKWYNHNFIREDYTDLRNIMASLKGKYLMNLNPEDHTLANVFGRPDFVKSYQNENQNITASQKPPRLKSFYTNV